MKECESCGAQIPEDSITCPYCGSEFMDLAEKEHKSIVRELKHDTQKLDWENQYRAEKAAKIERVGSGLLKRLGILLLVLIPIALILTAALTYLHAKHSLASREEALKALEEFYAERDYDAMDTYLDTKVKDSYSPTYRVYQDLADLAMDSRYWITCAEDGARYATEYKEEGALPLVSGQIYFLFSRLRDVEQRRTDDKAYQKDEAFAELDAVYRTAITEELLLTEEEINAKLKTEFKTQDDFQDYAQLVIDRVKEANAEEE